MEFHSIGLVINNNENSHYIIWPIFRIVSRNYYLQLHQPEKNHLLNASTNGEHSDQEFNDNTKYYISIRFQRSLRNTSEIGTVHIYNGCHELSVYMYMFFSHLYPLFSPNRPLPI